MTHGHVHGEGEWPDDWGGPGALSVRRLLGGLAAGALLLALCGLVVWWPRGDGQVDHDALGFAERVNATVTEAADQQCSYDPATMCRLVELSVDDAEGVGVTATLETDPPRPRRQRTSMSATP